MTSVSMISVTDPSSVNTESAGVEDAESSQGGKPAQPEPGKDLTAEEEALLCQGYCYRAGAAIAAIVKRVNGKGLYAGLSESAFFCT